MSNTAQTGINIVVTANTARALSQMQSFVSNVTRGLAALVGAGGLVAIARNAINSADALGKMAKTVNATVEGFTGMAFAAERSELSLEGLRAGIKGFTEYLVKTGRGADDVSEALLEQARIFAALPDGAIKSSLAIEHFGRAGIQMLPFLNEGEAGLRKLFTRGGELSGMNERLAVRADAFNDSLTDLKWATQGLALAFAGEALPRLTDFINRLSGGIVWLREWTRRSEEFRLALEALAATFVILTARKLAFMGTGALAAFIGAGAITSIKDFVAAIGLIPADAQNAVRALGPLAAIVALIVSLNEGRKAVAATQEAIDTTKELTERNIKLAESLRAVIKARQEAGALTAEEAVKLNDSVLLAQARPPVQAGKELGAVAAQLRDQPKAQGTEVVWTREELDLQNKLLGVEVEREQIMRVKSQLTFKETDLIQFLTVQMQSLSRIEDLAYQKRANAHAAFEQGAISKLEFDQADLEVRKELLAIDQARADISDEEYRRQAQSIAEDWRMTEAQKFDALSSLARNPAEMPVGPDPNDWAQQWEDALVRVKDAMGTWAQYVTGGVFSVVTSAANGLANALTAIAMGTATAGQAFAQFGRAVLANFINTIATAVIQAYIAIPILTALGVLTGGATAAAGSAITATAVSGTVGTVMGIAGREHGGPVTAGVPYVVGERRPELFVPNQDGVILPAVPSKMVSSEPQAGSGAAAAPQDIKFIMVADIKQAALEALASDRGLRIVVQHIDGRRLDLGLNT